jgi:uncharacterized membrane protein YgaE (UPF0421/DUF939 family)
MSKVAKPICEAMDLLRDLRYKIDELHKRQILTIHEKIYAGIGLGLIDTILEHVRHNPGGKIKREYNESTNFLIQDQSTNEILENMNDEDYDKLEDNWKKAK